MEDGVGGTTGGGDTSNRVFNGSFGDDFARRHVAAEEIHHEFTRAMTCVVFGGVGGGDAGKLHGRDAKKFGDESHGIGGELAAAGASARAGHFFEFIEFGIGHFAPCVRTDSFVDVLE